MVSRGMHNGRSQGNGKKDVKERAAAVADAAHLAIRSGAETQRSEELACYLAESMGFESIDILALPTGIFLSVEANDERVTLIKRIRKQECDLNKIGELNSISRDLCAGKISCERAIELIREQEGEINIPFGMAVAATALSCSMFAALFGGHGADILVSSISGVLVGIFLLRSPFNAITTTFICSLIVSFVVIWMGEDINKSIVTAGSIIPLLPGVELVSAVRDTIMGDIVSGASRVWYALLLSMAIAGGVVVSIWF